MAKPVLFYALVPGYNSRGHGFRLIGVTSEKGGQLYGRDEQDCVTHISARAVLHRFLPEETLTFCKAAYDRADATRKRLVPGVEEAERHARALRKGMEAAILDAAKGTRAYK